MGLIRNASFTVSLVILIAIGVRSEECNSQRAQQCRSALSDELERENDQQQQSTRRTTIMTNPRQDRLLHCRSIMDNLHCLVWQTANCLSIDERERNGDQIYKAWKYLSTTCDTAVGWRISQCFQRDDVRRCESLLRETSRTTTQDNCRNFISFKDCVENIVRAQCSNEDQSTMTMYILDQGREKAWKCSSADSRDRQFYDRQQAPLAEAGDTQDALCLSRSSGNIRGCSDRLYRDQDDARRYKDTQDRMHRECCASINFEQCVRDTVRNICQYVREGVVQTILDQNGVRSDPRCRYYGTHECSGAAPHGSALFVTLVTAIITIAKLLH